MPFTAPSSCVLGILARFLRALFRFSGVGL
jgi:hypothetical protein